MTQAHTNLSKHRWNHMLMDLCYDSHLSQLEAGSDRRSGGRRNPKISKTRKRSSTSLKRLPNDLRKHQRLPCEYQLIHPYDHRKKSPPISYMDGSFRPHFNGNGNGNANDYLHNIRTPIVLVIVPPAIIMAHLIRMKRMGWWKSI